MSISAAVSYECEVCHFICHKTDYLLQHIEMHLEKEPNQCEICCSVFFSKNVLRRHLLGHTKKIFTNPGKRKVEIPVRRQFTPLFPVTINAAHYVHVPTLKMPSVEHSNKPLSCNDEAQDYSIKPVEVLNEQKNATVQCQVCLKYFSNKYSLKRHSLKHTQKNPHICKMCFANFSSLDHLNEHLLTHSQENISNCVICCKPYENCIGHPNFVEIPQDENKNFECITCNKMIASKTKLRSHIRHHSYQRPYKCPVCHSVFQVESLFKTHLFLHSSSEKRYKCDVCYKAHENEDHLQKHLEESHKEVKVLEISSGSLSLKSPT